MKKSSSPRWPFQLWLLLLASALLSPCSVSAQIHAQYFFTNPQLVAQGIKTVRLTPFALFTLSGTNIVTGDSMERRANTGGSTTFSNLVYGNYLVEFLGGTRTTTFTNSFGTNLAAGTLVNAANYLTLSTNLPDGNYAYSMAAADARFAAIGSGGGGGNVSSNTAVTFATVRATAGFAGDLSQGTNLNPLVGISTAAADAYGDHLISGNEGFLLWTNRLNASTLYGIIPNGVYSTPQFNAASLTNNTAMAALGPYSLLGSNTAAAMITALASALISTNRPALTNYLHLEDFGAVRTVNGAATTNYCDAALSNAVIAMAARGLPLYSPSTKSTEAFYFSNTVTFNAAAFPPSEQGITIHADAFSRWRFTATNKAFLFFTNSPNNITLSGIYFDGPGRLNGTSIGLVFDGASGSVDDLTIENCQITGWARGMYGNHVSNSRINGTRFFDNFTPFEFVGFCNSLNFSGAHVIGNCQGGFIEKGTGIRMIGCEGGGIQSGVEQTNFVTLTGAPDFTMHVGNVEMYRGSLVKMTGIGGARVTLHDINNFDLFGTNGGNTFSYSGFVNGTNVALINDETTGSFPPQVVVYGNNASHNILVSSNSTFNARLHGYAFGSVVVRCWTATTTNFLGNAFVEGIFYGVGNSITSAPLSIVNIGSGARQAAAMNLYTYGFPGTGSAQLEGQIRADYPTNYAGYAGNLYLAVNNGANATSLGDLLKLDGFSQTVSTPGTFSGNGSGLTNIQLSGLQTAPLTIDWPSYFAQYPLVVPVRDFENSYTNNSTAFAEQLRVTMSSDSLVSMLGVIKRASGSYPGSEFAAYMPFGFSSPTNVNSYRRLGYFGSVLSAADIAGIIYGGDGGLQLYGALAPAETLTFLLASMDYPLLNPPYRGFTKEFTSGVSNRCVVLVPYPRPANNVKLAVMFGGNGADVYSFLAGGAVADYHDPNFLAYWTFMTALLTNNFVIAISEGGTQYADLIGGNWGNSNSWVANSNAIAWIQSQWTVTNSTIVCGSMGGLNGLRALAYYPTNVLNFNKIYGFFPVTSLTNAYRGIFTNLIETAYGFSGVANYQAATVGSDPGLFDTNVWAGKRMRFTTSASDTAVPRAWLDAFTNRVNQPSSVSVLTGSGAHGDASMIPISDFLNWWTP